MTFPISQSASGVQVLVTINALGLNGEYRTRNREITTDTAGLAVTELSVVPLLYVTRTSSAQRGTPALPVAQREALLAKTADTFTKSVIADDRLSRQTCCRPVSPPRDTANRLKGGQQCLTSACRSRSVVMRLRLVPRGMNPD
jgi:hypothetical protein